MNDDEKLEDSLAAWVPPWQRVTASAAKSPVPDPEPQPEPEPEPEPETTVPPASGWPESESDSSDADDEIVDTLADLAYAPSTASVSEDASDDSSEEDEEDLEGLDEDDYVDVQRPEADLLGAPMFGGDDEDEPQRPETDVADAPVPNRPDHLRGAVEAILLVVDEPVAEDMLAGVLNVTTPEVTEELTALAAEYNAGGRGFELRRAAGGWRLYTRGEFSAYVEKFVLDGQSVRLTQAALETLAVVAYQQPVTRSRMAAIRGVNCDGVVRTLVSRGLIEECGTQPESGAFLYKTTQLFLEKLGLDSLDQLPSLAPFLPDDVNGLVDGER